MLPNKPRRVQQVNDRRVLNGIFWVLRSGAPWRDLPETYGPRTTCYNRFVRWRQAGVWDQIMDALAAGHVVAVQMIDTSVVRVHQHGACIADNNQAIPARPLSQRNRWQSGRWRRIGNRNPTFSVLCLVVAQLVTCAET
jgi:transposase